MPRVPRTTIALMADSPAAAAAATESGTAAGAAAAQAARAFAELRGEPLVQALLAACGATACHLVGGALRDRALGLATHDLDAVVAGRGREIAGDLAASLPARLVLLGGEDFAAYRLVIGARDGAGGPPAATAHGHETREPAKACTGAVLDLWDRQATSLHDDLARRDFTVNSFALEPRSGAIVDPFAGLADLERRRLRATTERSFDGDPLRVLRLVRLLARLPGFTAEAATCELARRAAPRLPEMAAERIREELCVALAHAGAERALPALAALALYPGLWLGTPGAPAGPEGAAAAARAAAEIAALPGCAAELERLLAATATPQPEIVDLAAARFAATFRQLAALLPAAAAGPAGSAAPATALARMQEAGYLAARQAVAIAPLLAVPAELPVTELGRRRFLHRCGRGWRTVACSWGAAAIADDGARGAGGAAAGRWRLAAGPLCELARREGPRLIDPPRLLDGNDVQRLLGIAAGPRVGEALAALTAAQVDGAVRGRGEAERFLLDREAAVSARRLPAHPSGAG